MFTLIANHHDPTNTDILDANGQPVYHISTADSITSVADRNGALVGTLEFHMLSSNTIALAGQPAVPESDFLRLVGTWGRGFRGLDGRNYKWHNHDRTLQLTLLNKAESGNLLVFIPKRYHAFSDNEPGRFEINDGLRPMLDLVILTWVAIERRRQCDERRRSRNRHNAALINNNPGLSVPVMMASGAMGPSAGGAGGSF